MDTRRSVQMAVDDPHVGVRVVRVAGPLGATDAARLVRWIDAQVHLARSGQCRIEHLVVDLGGVTEFDPHALEALQSVEHACREVRIGLHLSGFCGRLMLLPILVRQALVRFSAFPSVEVALSSLGRGTARPTG